MNRIGSWVDELFTIHRTRTLTIREYHNTKTKINKLGLERERTIGELRSIQEPGFASFGSRAPPLNRAIHTFLSAPEKCEAEIELVNQVSNAEWTPSYDVKITKPYTGGEDKMQLISYANVNQSTEEEWSDVELVLSTA